MKRNLFFLFWLVAVVSCGEHDGKDAQAIVDRAIEAHGGDAFNHSKIAFDLRGRHYTTWRNEGVFVHTREFSDSTGRVKDVLNNDGFTRYVNDEAVPLPEERAQAFTNSVDGVIYFGLLPFRLNDPSVVKKYDGDTTLDGKEYYRIRVTFNQEGGGIDFEDVFLYWINKQTYRVDYFAYAYLSEGGGMRFRKAIGEMEQNGVVLQNYINYQPRSKAAKLEELEDLYRRNELEQLSTIEHENLQVELL